MIRPLQNRETPSANGTNGRRLPLQTVKTGERHQQTAKRVKSRYLSGELRHRLPASGAFAAAIGVIICRFVTRMVLIASVQANCGPAPDTRLFNPSFCI
jgi:hypothetical protein